MRSISVTVRNDTDDKEFACASPIHGTLPASYAFSSYAFSPEIDSDNDSDFMPDSDSDSDDDVLPDLFYHSDSDSDDECSVTVQAPHIVTPPLSARVQNPSGGDSLGSREQDPPCIPTLTWDSRTNETRIYLKRKRDADDRGPSLMASPKRVGVESVNNKRKAPSTQENENEIRTLSESVEKVSKRKRNTAESVEVESTDHIPLCSVGWMVKPDRSVHNDFLRSLLWESESHQHCSSQFRLFHSEATRRLKEKDEEIDNQKKIIADLLEKKNTKEKKNSVKPVDANMVVNKNTRELDSFRILEKYCMKHGSEKLVGPYIPKNARTFMFLHYPVKNDIKYTPGDQNLEGELSSNCIKWNLETVCFDIDEEVRKKLIKQLLRDDKSMIRDDGEITMLGTTIIWDIVPYAAMYSAQSHDNPFLAFIQLL
eukprot:CAMPEP_0194275386 /NCGR_PEP_ID=MMETSP0169-20130528/8237_1 /TAXON_ID=218684 /ORGANISM="Corethron pennatum, Strain L29A3" /LENGTH=425 /DNA_ID=CAMNT_0039018829 /DNA_START=255 /DNA_END=1532 /DNA_ORIENTATION=+